MNYIRKWAHKVYWTMYNIFSKFLLVLLCSVATCVLCTLWYIVIYFILLFYVSNVYKSIDFVTHSLPIGKDGVPWWLLRFSWNSSDVYQGSSSAQTEGGSYREQLWIRKKEPLRERSHSEPLYSSGPLSELFCSLDIYSLCCRMSPYKIDGVQFMKCSCVNKF